MYKVPVGKFGFLDGAVIEWLKERIALIAGCALALTMLIVWMVSHRSAADYRTAESIFNRWNGSSGKELVQLSKLLKQHPELHAKYDGRIAQKLLLCSEKGLAASFSQPIFKRVEPIFPYYTEFSRCSLLIGESRFQEALTSAQQLQHKLTAAQSCKVLSGYNLLRIAILYKAIGTNPQDELVAWRAFERTQDPDTYQLICQHFQKSDVSLKEFIQHCEASILAQHL